MRHIFNTVFRSSIRVNTGLDTNELIFFVFTNFISHMIDSCSLEVNETTLEFRLNYVMETIHEVYLDSLFLRKHLFGFSDFEFFGDISSPIFECFI